MQYKIHKNDGTSIGVRKEILCLWLNKRTPANYSVTQEYMCWWSKTTKTRVTPVYFENIEVCGVSHKQGIKVWEYDRWGKYANDTWSRTKKNTTALFIITDEYGRILCQEDLVKLAKEDVGVKLTNSEFKFINGYKRRIYRWSQSRRSYVFRRGPVPGTRKWRHRCWQKYAGDHAGPVSEKRVRYGDLADAKEIFEEYGVTFKVRRRRVTELSDTWGDHHHWLEKGWKQTRKKKQWM